MYTELNKSSGQSARRLTKSLGGETKRFIKEKKPVQRTYLTLCVGETLLLKPKVTKPLQTERVPRSSVLERLQNFLPQMAEANKKLKQQMDAAPAGHFDIENVKEAEKVIEMDVAVVELDSDSQSDEDEETLDSDDDDDDDREITERNLKLPGDRGKKTKANIRVLDQQAD